MINVGTVITKAQAKITDQSAETRAKMVTWFNEVARDICNQSRDWELLKQVDTLTIVNNTITVPTDASEIIHIKGSDFFLTPADQISDKMAFEIGVMSGPAVAYTLFGSTVTFCPATTGTVELKSELKPTAEYADNAATAFPDPFENLFITGILKHYYDFDKDGRYAKQEVLYGFEMKQIKAADNRLKPKPSTDTRSFIKI